MDVESVKYFINSEGLKIFSKYWHSDSADSQRPRAAVFVSHGAGEHCQKYERLANALSDNGMLVFSHDHVGHGLSEGDRMHINEGNTYISDVMQHVNMVKERYTGVPVFIIGHSMGGLIALKAALDNHDVFAGVVLIGPALVVDSKLTRPFWICIGKSLASILPQLQLKSIDPQLISRDQNIVKQYIDDPLVWHGGLKARWGMALLEMIDDVTERFNEVNFPLLILHGSDDRLCSPSGSQLLFDTAPTRNKVFKLYPGAYHQVHNEPDGRGDEVVSDIAEWIAGVLENSCTQPSPILLSAFH